MIERMNGWSTSNSLPQASPNPAGVEPRVAMESQQNPTQPVAKTNLAQKQLVATKSGLPVQDLEATTLLSSDRKLKPADTGAEFSAVLASSVLPQQQVPSSAAPQVGYGRNLVAATAIEGQPQAQAQSELPVLNATAGKNGKVSKSQNTGLDLKLKVGAPEELDASSIDSMLGAKNLLSSKIDRKNTLQNALAADSSKLNQLQTEAKSLSAFTQDPQAELQPWLMGSLSGLSGKQPQQSDLADHPSLDGSAIAGMESFGEVLDIQKTPAFKAREFSGEDFTDLMRSVADSRLARGKQKDAFGVGQKTPPLELGMVAGNGMLESIKDSKTKAKLNMNEFSESAAGSMVSAAQLKTGTHLAAPLELTAQVTSGANTKERLSTDSLMNLSTQIRGMSTTGGGVIHVRLKPENLGELNIKITNRNGRMGIDFQASDAKSKSIIEDSLHYLKESLTAQKVVVGQVDFTVAVQKHDAPDLAQFNVDLNQGRNQENAERQSFRNGNEGSRSTGENLQASLGSRGVSPALTRTSSPSLAQGRLDVTA